MGKLVRRQHVVSNFYLKEFADDRGHVRRIELPGKSQTLATSNASVIKDFYTVTMPDGSRSDVFERLFADIEGQAAAALKAVVHEGLWPVRGEQREALAAWIALQHLRSEGVRNSQTELEAQTIRLVVGASGKEALRQLISRSENRVISDDELESEWADITKPTGPDLISDPAMHIKLLMDLWQPTMRLVMARTWTVFRFSRRSLVTSDHPVSLVAGPSHPKGLGVGLATAQAFILLLSRKTGLMIGEIDEGVVPEFEISGTTVLARSFVNQAIKESRRYLYHHPEDRVLDGLDLPSVRSTEFGDFSDSLISEEGMFAGLWTDDSAQAPSGQQVNRSLDGGQEKEGVTINDLTWPIPNRRKRAERPREGG